MKANFHTHTYRCGHALGTDEAYVRAAVSQRFDVLGISDHVPWPYRSDFANPRVRMHIDQLDEYLESVRALGRAYQGKIRVLAGFEAEYFPEYMGWLAEMKEEKQLDYLIFANHFEGSDETGIYYGRKTRDAATLRRYVDSAIEGMRTGLFAYFAHPDLFLRGYPAFDDNCRAAARDLAQACRDLGLPMEYNTHERYFVGADGPKSYPHPEFFEIAAAQGAKIIIGLDAHEPQELSDPTQWELAEREIAALGVRRETCIAGIE